MGDQPIFGRRLLYAKREIKRDYNVYDGMWSVPRCIHEIVANLTRTRRPGSRIGVRNYKR